MKDEDRIRYIFGARRPFTRATAAAALGRSAQWVEAHRFSPENGDVVEWEEVVLLADGLWTKRRIHRALGEEAPRIFPSFALLAPLKVWIPAYKIIAIRDEARRRHLDVSELVGDHISVFRDEAEWLEQRHPGFVAAWRFPYNVE